MRFFDKIKNIRTLRLSIVVSLLGLVGFVLLYGVNVLNPYYTHWLQTGPDVPQHYFGWVAYRNSDWTWPFGLMDRLSYPYKTSVIFTDSIPLLALIFKILSSVLPQEFQYFGLWALLCFILSGLMAMLIIKKYTTSDFVVVAGSMLFVFAPVMLARIYIHVALAAQWLILLAFVGIIYREKLIDCGKRMIFWSALGALSASIHLYFVLMCGIILCGECLIDILKKQNFGKTICLIIGYVMAAVAVVYVFGGFESGMAAENVGLGIYSFNLNGFTNPMGWSMILNPKLTYGYGQYEGFAYVGLGIIVMLVIALIAVAKDVIKGGIQSCAKLAPQIVTAICVGGVALIVAVSPIVTFNESVIFEPDVPKSIEKLWSIFRASGRVAWIIVYGMMLCGICIVGKKFSGKVSRVIIGVLLIVQIVDISHILVQINEKFAHKSSYEKVLCDEAWEILGENTSIKHLVILDSGLLESQYYDYAGWALQNNKTINRFYFARSNEKAVWENIQACLTNPAKDTVFVTQGNAIIGQDAGLRFYRAGEAVLAYNGEIPGLSEIEGAGFNMVKVEFGTGQYLSGGHDKDGVRVLEPEGFSHGPYCMLAPGKYQIEISGTNLEGITVAATYEGGTQICEKTAYDNNGKMVSFVVNVPEIVNDFEILVINNSKQQMFLQKINIFTAKKQ